MRKSIWNRLIGASLAVAMVMTSAPVPAFAEGIDDAPDVATESTVIEAEEDAAPESEPELVVDATEQEEAANVAEPEAVETEEVAAEAEDESVETEEIKTDENKTEEKTWRDIFAENQSGADISYLDFESNRLIVGMKKDSGIIDTENVLASYKDVYLLQYDSEDDTKLAYGYYTGMAEFAAPDITVNIAAENENPTGNLAMTENENPITALNNALENTQEVQKSIALIDTGVSESDAVKERVSMLGNNVDDANGHGSAMAQAILEQYPEAGILSIKALDEGGKGNISSVYAAIKYAIAQEASVINLSLYAYSTVENAAIRDAIEDAKEAGITVVGAAGNDGADAKSYIPANMQDAVIIGACDATGKMLPSSNYGETVDYYVVAESTSKAAAIASAIIARDGEITADDKLVFADGNGKPVAAEESTAAEETVDTADDKEVSEEAPETEVSKKEEKNKIIDATIEKYILENADEKYGKIEKLELVNLMDAQQTVFPASAAPSGTTIDYIMGEDSKVIDQWMGSYWFTTPVYRVSKNADYFVALINTMKDDATAVVRDVDFARNNNNGIELTECVYDAKTGLAYMPAKYFLEEGSADTYAIGTVQAQLLQAIRGADVEEGAQSECTTVVNADGDVNNGTDADSIYRMETTVQAEPGLNTDKLTVTVNGNVMPDDMYTYNSNSGEVTVAMSSAAVGTVNVTEEKTSILEKVGKVFGAQIVHAKDASDISYVYGKKATKINLNGATAGDYLTGEIALDMMSSGTAAKTALSNKDYSPDIYSYKTEHNTGTVLQWDEKSNGKYKYPIANLINAIYNGGSLDYGDLQKEDNQWWMVINFLNKSQGSKLNIHGKSGSVNFKSLGYLPLICSHVTSPLGKMGGPIANESTDLSGTTINAKIRARIFEVSDGYAVIGFLAQEHPTAAGAADNGQTGTAVIKVPVKPTNGYLYLKKASSNPSITNGNANYSLAGAVYNVLDTNGTDVLDTITTNANGVSDIAEVNEPGTYYVQEKTAPAGYKLNTTKYPVVVTENNTTEENAALAQVTDEPITALVRLVKTSSLPDVTNGNPCYNMQGTQYGVYKSQADAASLINAVCVLTCGAENAQHQAISGVSPKLPIGTYYVREIKAGTNYLRDNTIYPVKLTAAHETTPYQVQAKDLPLMDPNEITLSKQIMEYCKDDVRGYNAPMTGAQFKIEYYAALTEDTMPSSPTRTWVIETKPDGKEFKATLDDDHKVSGDAIYKYADGRTGLPYGFYKIDEIKAPKNYQLEGALVNRTGESGNNFPVWAHVKKGVGDTGMYMEVENAPTHDLLVEEVPIGINTIAKDDTTDSHYAVAGETNVTDTIQYRNLLNGKSYKFKATLRDLTTGKVFAETTGDTFTAEAGPAQETEPTDTPEVTDPSGDDGNQGDAGDGDDDLEPWDPDQQPAEEEDLTFVDNETSVTFENINLESVAGHTLLIEEALYNGDANVESDEPIAVHVQKYTSDGNEYGMSDEEEANQTLYVPEIKTTATDDETGIHVTYAKDTANVTDRVTLKNFEDGTVVKITGQLMKITEEGTEPLLDADGNEITASAEVTINDELPIDEKTQLPYAEIHFSFKADGLEDTKAVAFEKAYLVKDDTETFAARHEDPTDKEQFDYLPKIDTEMSDDETGSNHTLAKEEATATDRVDFSNVQEDIEYDVFGVLMDKETGEPLTWKDDEGNDCYPELIAATYDGEDVFVPEETTGEGALAQTVAAHAHFKAKGNNGAVYLTFKFNSKAIEGTTVVAFEEMKTIGKTVAIHADIESYPQTEFTPKVRTSIKSDDTQENLSNDYDLVHVTDTVAFKGLDTLYKDEEGNGRKYYLVGELHKQNVTVDEEGNKTITDGGVVPSKMYILNEDGEEVEVEETAFVPETSEGTYDVLMKLDASEYAGESLVAFEKLYTHKDPSDPESEKVLVGVHEEIDDEAQTLHFPKIHTTAIDGNTGLHIGNGGETITVQDRVFYENLVPGKEYTLTGKLMHILEDADKDNADQKDDDNKDDDESSKPIKDFIDKMIDKLTGDGDEEENKGYEELTVDGEPVTATATFTPEEADGSVLVTFEFDGKDVEDANLVAFEYLFIHDVPIAEHEDPEDPKQTVIYPKLRTTAEDGVTVTHVADSGKNTLTDTIDYWNVELGREYTIRGELHDKKDGALIPSEMIDDEGNVVDGVTFTPEEKDGQVQLKFRYDATRLAGHTIVVYETMTTPVLEEDLEDAPWDENGEPAITVGDEKIVGDHKDLEDEAQSNHIPAVSTTFVDAATGAQDSQVTENATFNDKVQVTNIVPGHTYELQMRVWSTVKGKFLTDEKGNEIVVTDRFEGTEADMERVLSVKLNTLDMVDDVLVAFEKLFIITKDENGEEKPDEVARHEDPNAPEQSIRIVDIHTTMLDASTKSHEAGVSEKAKHVDRVYYNGLEVGKEYTVTGTLMNKKTRKPVKKDGKPVTATKTFKPTAKDGYIDLTFEYDSSKLAGKSVVAFEEVSTKVGDVDTVIAVHKDLNDADQTVNIIKIKTKLTDKKTGKKTASEGNKTELVDTVICTGLTKGETYSIKGTLMDKSTGKSTGIKAKSDKFKATGSKMKVKITFVVDTNKYAGKDLVAFEKLYGANGKLITSHEDIEDKAQTIHVPGGTRTPGSGSVKTGDTSKPIILVIIAAAALAGVIVMIRRRRGANRS